MSWEFYTAICVLGLSISIVLQRVLIHKYKVDPFGYAVVFQALVGLLLMVPALTYGFKLPGIEIVWLPAIIAIISYGIGHVVYAKTLQRVEASAFSMLFATHAVWVMILGIILFQETLTVLQVIGTILIFLSILVITRNFRSIFRDKGTLYGLLTGLLFGIAITAWSYVGRYTDTLSWAAISFIIPAFFVLLIRPKTIHSIRPLLTSHILSRLIVLGIFYGIGAFTMLLAYKYGDFAVVSPLRQAGVVVTVLLALSFLPTERNNITKKILAAIICTVGVVLIVA